MKKENEQQSEQATAVRDFFRSMRPQRRAPAEAPVVKKSRKPTRRSAAR